MPCRLTLTGRHLEALKLDRFDVVDQSGHLLGGVDLTAGRALKHRAQSYLFSTVADSTSDWIQTGLTREIARMFILYCICAA